ncbi:MAG: stage V sporulation protein SpoVM [Oscillospiraceae bacterium]|nr:stage V sporulation protein SpoVM [Oscillospiraceae bacterium]MCR5167635.1 stage V sporulation protein SpoVM [Oscillospiraceae bacterium]
MKLIVVKSPKFLAGLFRIIFHISRENDPEE